jgi:hypothetical protein
MRPGSASFVVLISLASWLASAELLWSADIDRDLPDTTESVFVINVRQILDAPVIQKLIQTQLQPAIKNNADDRPWLSLLEPETLRDLTRITFAFPKGLLEKKGAIIVKGRFDLNKIRAAAEQLSETTMITVKIHPNDKTPLYEILVDEPGTSLVFSTFLDKETLFISRSRDTVIDAITRRARQKPSKLSADLQGVISKMDSTLGIWLAGRVPEQWKQVLGNRPQLKAFAPKLEAFSGGVRCAQDIYIALHLKLSDAQAAVDFRQTLELSKLLVNVAIANSADVKDYAQVLTDIVNSLKFTQEQNTVSVEVTIPDAQIDKALKKPPEP